MESKESILPSNESVTPQDLHLAGMPTNLGSDETALSRETLEGLATWVIGSEVDEFTRSWVRGVVRDSRDRGSVDVPEKEISR